MNTKWVIAYDLNVKAMKAAGYTQSNVTAYYNKLKAILTEKGFRSFTQNSIYSSTEDQALLKGYEVIDAIRSSKDPQYVNRLHLFKVDHFTDLRPLLPEAELVEEIDSIETEIEAIFRKEQDGFME